MLPYLLHVSILVTGSYFFYTLFLGKETFFSLNRWVLMGCLLAAFALPFLEIPEEWSIRSNDSIASFENQITEYQKPIEINNTEKEIIPVQTTDNQEIKKTNPEPIPVQEPQKSQWNWMMILKYIYLTGLAVFSLNFLVQLVVLVIKILKNPIIKDGQFRIVEVDKDSAPFSFLNNIFLNPTKYDWDTYNHILDHEKIHIKGKHTLDILIAELVVIVQWFNPFAWLYRKAIENNLEYLTDLKMLKEGTDRKAYQMNLLKVSVPNLPLNLTTNYNQSILKKRILMMNAKKSSVRSSWKYFFLLPALGLSVICLNSVKTSAKQLVDVEQMEQKIEDVKPSEKKTVIIQTQSPTSKDKEESFIIEGENWYTVAKGAMIYGQELPPKGTWTAKIEGTEICIQFKSEKIKGNWWARKTCYPNSAFKALTISENANFTLEREAGTVKFEGNFYGNEGDGTFSFTENTAFKSYLVGLGYIEVTEQTMFNFALTDVNKSYLNFIKEQGYNASFQELQYLATHNTSKEKVKEYIDKSKQLGIEKVTLNDIVQFEIHDINMDYVLEMKDLLKEDLTVQNVVQAGIHDLNPDYIKSIKSEGYPNMTFNEIVQFGIHDIEASYIKELKAAGLTNLKSQEIVQAAIHDIDANYLKELKGAGFEDLSFNELIQFGIHDIDGEYIKKIRSSGLDLTTNQMVQAAIHDIDADYLKELQGAGFENISFDEVIQFGIHNIDSEYIRELQASGLDLNTNEMVQAAIHDIDAEKIKELKASGYPNLEFKDIIQFGIHDIDAEYIRKLKSAGLDNLTKDQVVQAAIHGIESNDLKKLQNSGYPNIEFNEVIQFGIHGIDAEYIQSFNEVGLNNLSAQEIIQAAIHGVEAKEIKQFKELGYSDLAMQEIVQFSIHDVDAEYINSIKALGFTDASHQDLIQSRIHDVDEDFIKKSRSEGKNLKTLQEYIQLRVESYDNGKRKRIE